MTRHLPEHGERALRFVLSAGVRRAFESALDAGIIPTATGRLLADARVTVSVVILTREEAREAAAAFRAVGAWYSRRLTCLAALRLAAELDAIAQRRAG